MIGVIGGNGVAATNRLCQLIEEKLTQEGAYRDAHHPEMIIWQATHAPSRSMYLEGRGPSWIEDYVEIGKKLKGCGCTKLCMCCNTAHYAIDVLESQIGLPFINLLEQVAVKCKINGATRVGMMCSDGLRKVGLYEKCFSTIAPDIEFIYPENDYQEMVTLGICNAKNKIRFSNPTVNSHHPYNCIMKVCSHLIEKKADTLVLGCTDLNNIFQLSSPDELGIKVVDSLDVLADSIIDEFKNSAR